jgi:hypothetical protein
MDLLGRNFYRGCQHVPRDPFAAWRCGLRARGIVDLDRIAIVDDVQGRVLVSEMNSGKLGLDGIAYIYRRLLGAGTAD